MFDSTPALIVKKPVQRTVERRSRLSALVSMTALLVGCIGPASTDPPDQPGVDGENGKTGEPLYLAPNFSTWFGGYAPVCFTHDSNYVPSNEDAVINYLNSSWMAAANINFVNARDCASPQYPDGLFNSSSNPAKIQVSFLSFQNTNAQSGCQSRPGSPDWFITVNQPVNGSYADDNGYNDASLTQEFGHAMGITHEQDRPENWGPSGTIYCHNLSDGLTGPMLGGNNLGTPYDPNSVMNYCDPLLYQGAVDDPLSTWDISGIRQLYGRPAINHHLAFSDPTNNDLVLWNMRDGAHVSSLRITNALLGQKFVAAGDFDGDAFPDFLLQNTATNQLTVQLTTGTNTVNLGEATAPKSSYTLGTMPAGYQVVATGDFNYDSRPDLVLENPSTGAMQIWRWTTSTPPGVLTTSLPALASGWRVAGTGSSGIGTGDASIVFQNITTEATSVAFISNGLITSQTAPPANGVPLQAVFDFNSDNVPDFLWRTTSLSWSFVWRMKIVGGAMEMDSASNFYTGITPNYVAAGTFQSFLGYADIPIFYQPRSGSIWWDSTAHQLVYTFYDTSGNWVNNQKLPTTSLTLLNTSTINF